MATYTKIKVEEFNQIDKQLENAIIKIKSLEKKRR